MMPSRARLASATAAGVVGLAVAGLILFGTDPLGTGSTTIAVPASPPAAGSGPSVDTEDWEDSRASAERPSTDPSVSPGTSGSADRAGATRPRRYRPATTYGPAPSQSRHTIRSRQRTTTTTARPASPTTARPKAKPTTAAASPRPSATTTRTPSSQPSASSASPKPSTAKYEVRRDWAAAVLDRLNQQRAAHDLPALTGDDKLTAAAHSHNVQIADADSLSHQLPGEPGLGERISAAGYSWSAVGENVAWSSNRSEAGVLSLQDAMYNETPPNDGHRRNILSSSFTEVGIDVIIDAEHGKVWLVTDFGKPS